jgi:hypothetical protein
MIIALIRSLSTATSVSFALRIGTVRCSGGSGALAQWFVLRFYLDT